MTLCKDCIHCQQVKYDGGNRSVFRQGDDYLYYCHLHDKPVPNEYATCKDAEE